MKRTIALLAALVAPLLPAADPSFSLRNFRQLRGSLLAATGIKPSNALLSYYNGAQFRLLVDGDPAKFTATTLLTTISLTGYFCDELIAAEQAISADRRRAFPMLDFNKPVSAVTHENQVALVTRQAEIFWGREPEPVELTQLVDAWTMLAAVTPDSAAGVRQLALSACTLAGSSLEAIRF